MFIHAHAKIGELKIRSGPSQETDLVDVWMYGEPDFENPVG